MRKSVEREISVRCLAVPSTALAYCASLLATAPNWAATPPVVNLPPQASAATLIADDTTPYTITTVVTDVDGYNCIRNVRNLFGYTESGGDSALGRGYFNWGKTDADITQYGGTWVLADATGGGRWGYRSDAWGGTTYLTPISCQMTPGGQAGEGSGTRTVSFTFTVKPAWAFNPVMNDADVWTSDSTYTIGWSHGGAWFDVVAAPCSTLCVTPRAPVLSNVTATTVNLAINPADSSVNLFCVTVSPSVSGKAFLQSDGTLGTRPQWYSGATWGTRTVQGLTWNTPYSFSVRASRSVSGYCPSPWGPAAQVTTLDVVPALDFRLGTPFSTWVRGQSPYRSITTSGWAPLWDLTIGSLGRGVAGGLDADTYDWRNINSGANWGLSGGHFTTLEFLQQARDHNAGPMITANVFGGGYQDPNNGNTFVCQTVNPEGLAADWVRYTNFIAQNYRQGQESQLTGEDLRVYNSIANWGGRAFLLTPGEEQVPRVQYWEIGNEPEVGTISAFLTNHYLSPTNYRDYYKSISQAMLAVDPTLKVGPCLITPSDPAGSGQWLTALATDPAAPIDFVGYHPYYGAIKSYWGSPEGMTGTLCDYRAFLLARTAGIRSLLASAGRSNVDLIASEWNPVNWDAPGYMQSSMANALGVVETCFCFAEDGVLGGNFWEQPQSKLAVSGAFAGMVSDMGDSLIASSTALGLPPSNCAFRFYVTKNQGDDSTMMIWGINFSDDTPVTVNFRLPTSKLLSATLKRYGKPGPDNQGGDTSLTASTGLAWDQQDVTAGLDLRHFAFTMEDAEITVLVLHIVPSCRSDFDWDGDVDIVDFGHLQACLTGPGVPQVDPYCADTLFTADTDVDGNDMVIFLKCLTGPDVPSNPNCEQ